MTALRPYQKDCLEALREKYRLGQRRLLIVLPTGSGKTVIASHLPDYFPELARKGILFLVHREELVQQAYQQFAKRGLAVTIERAEDYAEQTATVVIASVQTLCRKSRLERFSRDAFGIVFVDEAHHAIAESYLSILRYFRVYRGSDDNDPSKLLVGLTATPERADNVGLEQVFEAIAYSADLSQLIQQGYLVPVHAMLVHTQTNLTNVPTRHGDFVETKLAEAVDNEARNNLIARTYADHKEGQALAFTVTIEHSHNLARALRNYGQKAAVISGRTPKGERAELVERFKQGEIDVLISAGVFNEGFDAPNATVGLMARPTLSGLLYRQQVGRVLRPYPAPEEQSENGYRKQRALILDFVDNTARHGSIVTLPSIFGLPPKLNLNKRSALHEAAKFEDALSRYRHPKLFAAATLEELQAIITDYLDILKPIAISAAAKKYSKYAWSEPRPGDFMLALPSGPIISVHQNALGQYEVCRSVCGERKLVTVTTSLAEAISAADRLVPVEDHYLLLARASWRSMPPTVKQAKFIWVNDPDVRRKYPTPEDFYDFLVSEYNRDNMDCSRGALSMRISFILSLKGRNTL